MDSITLNFLTETFKIMGSIIALIAAGITLWVKMDSESSLSSEGGKPGLDALYQAIERASDNAVYKQYLEGICKERIAALVYKRSVRLGDMDRVMEYRQLGFATTKEMGMAWDHRTPTGEALSFRLNKWEILLTKFIVFYCIVCFLLGIIASFFGYAASGTVGQQLVFTGVLFFVLAASTLYGFRSFITAWMLMKREKLHQERQAAALQPPEAPAEMT